MFFLYCYDSSNNNSSNSSNSSSKQPQSFTSPRTLLLKCISNFACFEDVPRKKGRRSYLVLDKDTFLSSFFSSCFHRLYARIEQCMHASESRTYTQKCARMSELENCFVCSLQHFKSLSFQTFLSGYLSSTSLTIADKPL